MIQKNCIINKDKISFKDFLPAKSSKKSKKYIKAFAANTYKGLVRMYNEDRVSIILNMAKPKKYKDTTPWPICSFFSVYDGHAGSACADFLKDNLHKFIINNPNFPGDPKKAIIEGFS